MKGLAVVMALMIFGTTIAGAPAAVQLKPNPEADRILLKMRRMQIVDQLLPVLLTKEQIKQILPTVEKARQNEDDRYKDELKKMKELEPELDKALEAAIKEQKTAEEEFVVKYQKTFSALERQRKVLIDFSAGQVLKKMKEVLNVGQLKAAENALDPRLFGEKDPESMSSDAKLTLWVREVLLDRASYDLLVDMSR